MFVNHLTIPNRLARLGLGYMIRDLQRKLYRKAKEGIRRAIFERLSHRNYRVGQGVEFGAARFRQKVTSYFSIGKIGPGKSRDVLRPKCLTENIAWELM